MTSIGVSFPIGPCAARRRQRRTRPLVGVASERLICPAGVEPAISGAQSRRGGQTPLQAGDLTMKWEEGLASLKRGGALLALPVAIRCSSARLPATVVDRQRDALSP